MALLRGLKVTLELSVIIWTCGIVLGAILGSAAAHWRKSVGVVFQVTSFIFSGIPILVFLYWMHCPVQTLLGIIVNPFYTAAVTFTVINVFLVANLVMGVLRDFPTEYIVAARVCGLPSRSVLFRIQLPIILRQLIPGLLTTQVIMLQSTLFASLISVEEIFRVSQQINARIYRPIEIYTALGGLFLIVCLPVNGLALYLRARFTRSFSEQ